MDPIYKIVPKELWTAAREKGRFDGAPVDESDGFIHFSNGAQVRDTAARHFAGQDGLLLVAVDPERLGAALKHEPSRGGALFPHLYGPLPMEAVLWVEELGLGADGHHQFPGSIR